MDKQVNFKVRTFEVSNGVAILSIILQSMEKDLN